MDSKSSLQNLFLPFCTQGVRSTVHSTHFYVWTCPKERQFSFQQMSDELNVNDTLRAELTACYLGLMLRGWRIHFCVEFTICKSPLIWIMFNNHRHFWSGGHVYWMFFNMNTILQPKTFLLFSYNMRISIWSFPTDVFQMLARNSVR